MTTNQSPWTVDACEDAHGHFSIRCLDGSEHGDTRSCLATVYDEGDAKLIAAAPELLEALKVLLFNVNHGNGAESWLRSRNMARDAIIKAGSHPLGA